MYSKKQLVNKKQAAAVCLACMQIGQNVMHAPHLVHMHWWPQSRQTVFVVLPSFAAQFKGYA